MTYIPMMMMMYRLKFIFEIKRKHTLKPRIWKRKVLTASTLIIHIERQKLECGTIFCKTYDEK